MSIDNKDDTVFEDRTRKLLDGSVERLDAYVSARLVQARRAALVELDRSSARRIARFMIPAGGIAASVAIALLLLGGSPEKSSLRTAELPLEHSDLVAATENFELFEQTIYQYDWYGFLGPENCQDANARCEDASYYP